MISNAHFWNAGARSYNPICLNPLLVLEKITPLPGSSVYLPACPCLNTINPYIVFDNHI